MRTSILFLAILLVSTTGFAHTINYVVDELPTGNIIQNYIEQGFLHILPMGIDHILFITAIFFLHTDWRKIVLQATVFTLAHTITLGLSMYDLVDIPSTIIEPLIALSIAFLALENIWLKQIRVWRLLLIFLFGLIHGLGFAGALAELGLPRYAFAEALISFNIGVELGQLTVIGMLYLLCFYFFNKPLIYKKYIVVPASIAISAIGIFWTIERIFLT
jgi:hypothetical protein